MSGQGQGQRPQWSANFMMGGNPYGTSGFAADPNGGFTNPNAPNTHGSFTQSWNELTQQASLGPHSDAALRRMQEEAAASALTPNAFPPQHFLSSPIEQGNLRPTLGTGARLGSNPNPAPVPLPPQRLSVSDAPQVTTPTGPMSSTVVIPPRPRPGRKPLDNEFASDRRRLQNRQAQRNFRDKRAQKLVETQQELIDCKQDYQEEINELRRELDAVRQQKKGEAEEYQKLLKQRDDNLRQEKKAREAAESKIAELEKKMPTGAGFSAPVGGYQNPAGTVPYSSLAINTNQRGQMNAFGGASVPTPPEDNTFGEIDFTYYSSNQAQQPTTTRPATNNNTFGGMDMTADERCGFCTDDQNCSCRPQNNVAQCAPVPGTCDACQRDPNRAQACRDLALAADLNAQAAFDANSMTGSMGPPPKRMSCSMLIDEFGRYNQRTSSISELFGGQLRAYPALGGGYEIEEQEAAEVLQNLSRRNTMAPQEQPPNET